MNPLNPEQHPPSRLPEKEKGNNSLPANIIAQNILQAPQELPSSNKIISATSIPPQFPIERIIKTHNYLFEDTWKFYIDGCDHEDAYKLWGKDASLYYDKPRYDHRGEPGYLEGVLNAHKYIDTIAGMPMTEEIYASIHKIACAHMKGSDQDSTFINGKDAGKYRNPAELGVKCEIPILSTHPIDLVRASGLIIPKRFTQEIQRIRGQNAPFEKDFKERAFKEFINKCYEEWYKKLVDKIDLMEAAIGTNFKVSSQYRYKIRIDKEGKHSLDIFYPKKLTQENYKEIIDKIFQYYYRNLSNDEESNTAFAAQVFQWLDLLHPFEDGQGRTDLLVLGKLLSDQNRPPPILKYPYISTWVDLPTWIYYLHTGINTTIELNKKMRVNR